jgi:hypothetical protein
MPDGITIGHLILATSYSRTACRRTTIGAAAFHFRVRNGNGWCHYATVTRVRNRTAVGCCRSDASTKPSLWGLRDSNFERTRSFLIRWHLHTGFRKCCPPSLKLRRDRQLKASFCFEIFCLLCLPLRKTAERLNRKVKDQAERVISTPELNTLLCLHPEPINVVVYHDPSGRSHLGTGLALRCFQRLSFPNIATQRCR